MFIAIDFDGTCVDHRYPEVGNPAPNSIETLKALNLAGFNLILWTMRSEEKLQDAINWFKDNDISLFGIQRNPTQDSWSSSPKCYAHVYIDDAAFGAPLIKPEGFARPCIDWSKVRDYFLGVSA